MFAGFKGSHQRQSSVALPRFSSPGLRLPLLRNSRSDWVYLETGQDNKMTVMECQSLNRNEVCSRRGCLYIMDVEVICLCL